VAEDLPGRVPRVPATLQPGCHSPALGFPRVAREVAEAALCRIAELHMHLLLALISGHRCVHGAIAFKALVATLHGSPVARHVNNYRPPSQLRQVHTTMRWSVEELVVLCEVMAPCSPWYKHFLPTKAELQGTHPL
jgi:hypothetical protein